MSVAKRGRMRCFIFSLCALVASGCDLADDSFADKGAGTWLAMLEVPDIDYRAIHGVAADDVYAVGAGGIAHYDGDRWQRVSDAPDVEYRAVWARSSSQVWIGGDGVLLARSLTGWQEQTLWHDGLEIVDYSVLALVGDARQEYAIVMTGGKLLLLINEGAAWDTPYWRGGNGPGRPLPLEPSAIWYYGKLLVAGDADLVECREDEWQWESYRRPGASELPALTGLSGGVEHWVAASRTQLFVHRAADDELLVLDEDREVVQPRAIADVFAPSAGRIFVIGGPVHLRTPDDHSGVLHSPVEACDLSGCALEAIEAGYEGTALRALWGDGLGTVMAAGDGVILARQVK